MEVLQSVIQYILDLGAAVFDMYPLYWTNQ